jgi:hypothetical protein
MHTMMKISGCVRSVTLNVVDGQARRGDQRRTESTISDSASKKGLSMRAPPLTDSLGDFTGSVQRTPLPRVAAGLMDRRNGLDCQLDSLQGCTIQGSLKPLPGLGNRFHGGTQASSQHTQAAPAPLPHLRHLSTMRRRATHETAMTRDACRHRDVLVHDSQQLEVQHAVCQTCRACSDHRQTGKQIQALGAGRHACRQRCMSCAW